MKVAFRIRRDLLNEIALDLNRSHPFAAERVGFISCRVGRLDPSGWVMLAHAFHSVCDEDYVEDYSVGAMMGPAAIRKAMQVALTYEVGMFHVHIHAHHGRPWFSGVDVRETARFVPDFWHVRPHMVHGAVLLSLDSLAGLCWHPQAKLPIKISQFTVVGAPTFLVRDSK